MKMSASESASQITQPRSVDPGRGLSKQTKMGLESWIAGQLPGNEQPASGGCGAAGASGVHLRCGLKVSPWE